MYHIFVPFYKNQVVAGYREAEPRSKVLVSTTLPANTGSRTDSSSATATAAPSVSGDSELERMKKITAAMMDATKQPEDICLFYLDGAGWDLTRAVELFHSMST